MPWQQIHPRFVRQDHPHLKARWYRDTSERGGGELILWLDPTDRVVAFQLTLEEWPSLEHHVAHWEEGSALRIGAVDEEPASDRVGLRPTPIIRYPTPREGASPESASRLLDYFRQNADTVHPKHRHQITSILSEAAA
ncbi:MAG TPA: hypothetical protein VFN74_01715 [Chloroflexota bacterium]|nr:hypothetical protein [Chloroflexota bacterium]